MHIPYLVDVAAYTNYYNAPVNNNGNPNLYYNASCTVSENGLPNKCAPVGCTDLLDCMLDVSDNKVYSILFRSAMPLSMVGTTDNNYYTHYSVLATLEQNWGLDSLMHFDHSTHVIALL